MYKNHGPNGRKNLCGTKITQLRKSLTPKLSQKKLADQLLLSQSTLDLDKNAIQRIESGERFVTDIELQAFSKFFGVTTDSLLTD